ncbi:hypothetical protein GCM10020001_002670 [Nonomuraea salmonea]
MDTTVGNGPSAGLGGATYVIAWQARVNAARFSFAHRLGSRVAVGGDDAALGNAQPVVERRRRGGQLGLPGGGKALDDLVVAQRRGGMRTCGQCYGCAEEE